MQNNRKLLVNDALKRVRLYFDEMPNEDELDRFSLMARRVVRDLSVAHSELKEQLYELILYIDLTITQSKDPLQRRHMQEYLHVALESHSEGLAKYKRRMTKIRKFVDACAEFRIPKG